MLDKEFKYFLDHQKELVEKYNGKFIVIKNENVIGAYDTEEEAIRETLKTHKAGTFLVQHCVPGNQEYTQKFRSRIIFA